MPNLSTSGVASHWFVRRVMIFVQPATRPEGTGCGEFHGGLRVRRSACANQITTFLTILLAASALAGCAGVTSSSPGSTSGNPTAASITAQPASQNVTVGLTATFTVSAAGTAPLAYQWQKNGANIANAAAASYTTPVTTMADNGSKFGVVISNSAGTVTSAAATLTVNAAS